VHRVRHGHYPPELGGTNVDDPNANRFLKYYMEELRNQFRSGGGGASSKDKQLKDVADELRKKWEIKK